MAEEEQTAGPTHPARVREYLALVQTFVDGGLPAAAFESTFRTRYLSDETGWTTAEFDVLDRLFADVDDFVPDDLLRAEAGGLDEAGLRRRAAAALPRLVELSEAERG